MGSKSDIAKQIVDILPAADILIDLFAGGCAITHAALLSGKWKKIINLYIFPSALLVIYIARYYSFFTNPMWSSFATYHTIFEALL